MECFVVDAVRTPIGKYGGSLASVRPDDLLAGVLRQLMLRNERIDLTLIEDVIAGCANQSGEDNRNVARMALLLAGLPETTAGTTVNRLCASGLQAIMDAARCIKNGEGMIYLAGGVESMTRAPFVMGKQPTAWGRQAEVFDTTLGWRFINPALSALYYPYTMGETAENVARQWNITREEQDNFALNSQVKYSEAEVAGKFLSERINVHIRSGKSESVFSIDEHPRVTTAEKLASLAPAFAKEGTVTAGNSSGINDGAAALLLVNEQTLKDYNLQPLARVVSMAVAGVNPGLMGIGPVPATQKVLKRAGLRIKDIELVELNEAFAAQSIACIRDLEIDPQIVNVNGGSIALGHPLGCSGARISATLLHEMKRRGTKYGLATMCIGVGQGSAIIYEGL
jgi:acetyl-CoA C-acetyltransferase